MRRETASAKANRAATIGRVHGNGHHLADTHSPYIVTADRRIDLSTRVDLKFDVYVLVGLVRDVSFASPKSCQLGPY